MARGVYSVLRSAQHHAAVSAGARAGGAGRGLAARAARWSRDADSGYARRVGPYREADATEILEVPAREGRVRLELGPRSFRVQVGERLELTVAEDFATLIKVSRRRRRKKQRSIRLGQARLLLARGVPTNDIGIWHEPSPGLVERLVGMRPPELLDNEAMGAWHLVDRMAQRLREVLAPHAHGVLRAIEVGQGADRVLITDLEDRLELYVRRLFRERARRAMEAHRDGTVVLAVRGGTTRVECHSRYGITVIGDYIRFADPTGADLGALSIPWISPEDRRYLVRLIGQVVDPREPRPLSASARGSGDRP